VVAAGLADRCEVQVAYAIGKAHPVSLYVETFGTENVPVERIERAIGEVFDLRPAAIIRDLDLLKPIYQQTAAYGHFGRELPGFTWERTDRIAALKSAAGAQTQLAERPVARVCVDVSLPHLDRPFDYLVPAKLSESAQPGVRVRVRFAGQLVDGFVLERIERSEHGGRLANLERVV